MEEYRELDSDPGSAFPATRVPHDAHVSSQLKLNACLMSAQGRRAMPLKAIRDAHHSGRRVQSY